MIVKISGILIDINVPYITVDTKSGIAYEIQLPMKDCEKLPTLNNNIEVYTHFITTEYISQLYGFLDNRYRNLFRKFIKISTVGPKIALTILSTLSISEIETAIYLKEIDTLCRVPGIGKKMAERILLEFTIDKNYTVHRKHNNNDLFNDVINALTNLGYNNKEINTIIKKIPNNINNLEDAIKFALQLLNKSS